MWPEATRVQFNHRQKAIRDMEWGVTQTVLQELKGKEFLEIGCGTGYAMSLAQGLGFSVAGVDPQLGRHGVAFEAGSLNAAVAVGEKLPFADASFDVVYSSHALEHFSDREKGLQEMARVLRPDGHIIILVPSGTMALINYLSQLFFTSHIRFGRFLLRQRNWRHFRYMFLPQAHGEHAASVLGEVKDFSEANWRNIIAGQLQILETKYPGLYPYPDFPQWFPMLKLSRTSSSLLFVCKKK